MNAIWPIAQMGSKHSPGAPLKAWCFAFAVPDSSNLPCDGIPPARRHRGQCWIGLPRKTPQPPETVKFSEIPPYLIICAQLSVRRAFQPDRSASQPFHLTFEVVHIIRAQVSFLVDAASCRDGPVQPTPPLALSLSIFSLSAGSVPVVILRDTSNSPRFLHT